MTIDTRQNGKNPLSQQRKIGRRFLMLVIVALVLICVLVWVTLAVLGANDIEPFGVFT